MNEGAECQTISPAAKKGSYILVYFDIESFVIIIFKYVFIQDGRQLIVPTWLPKSMSMTHCLEIMSHNINLWRFTK